MAAPTSAESQPVSTRIASVDIYRGMVMFLMLAEILHLKDLKTFVGPDSIFSAIAEWVSFHADHVEWRGCSLHDMIQPSFSFLVGTAMAFSIAARSAKGQSWNHMLGHAVVRSFILIFLGIFLRSLGHPITRFTFDDTLTQIGLGYWILFLLSSLSIRGIVVSVAVILVGYWLAFVMYPSPDENFPYDSVGVPASWPEHYQGIASHFNKNSNLAWAFDRWWMNLFPVEKPFLYSGGGYCTLSFIPTLGTMLLGLIAGRILLLDRDWKAKQGWLWAAAAICALLALVVDGLGLCPIVKRIWTPAWALWSGGICFAWLGILNLICDRWGKRAWAFPFLVIGANSIVAYVMSWTLETPIHDALERHFGFILTHTGASRPFVMGALSLILMWLVLLWLYRKRVFVKI